MTVIDAHHHVWDLAVRDQPWLVDADEIWPPSAAASAPTTCVPPPRRPASPATVLVQTVVTVAAETPEMLAIAKLVTR